MADTVDVNAQGDAVTAVETKVTEENTVESTETVATPEDSTNGDANITNQEKNEEVSSENAAVKRKAEDTAEQDVDESKKSKVENAVENGHPTNGHTDLQPTAVAVEKETPAVESTEDLPDVPSKTVEDVERLKAGAEENVAA